MLNRQGRLCSRLQVRETITQPELGSKETTGNGFLGTGEASDKVLGDIGMEVHQWDVWKD